MVFLKPPQELNEDFYAIHKYLKSQFGSIYKTFYKRQWHSHIRLFGGTFFKKDENKLIEIVKNTVMSKPINIKFSEVFYQKGYLMLKTTEETNAKCLIIYENLSGRLLPLRSNHIRAKYKKIDYKLSKAEKLRLQNTGTIYDYYAHLSLGAFVKPYILKDFESILNFSDILKTEFNCNEYYIEITDINHEYKKVYGPFKLSA